MKSLDDLISSTFTTMQAMKITNTKRSFFITMTRKDRDAIILKPYHRGSRGKGDHGLYNFKQLVYLAIARDLTKLIRNRKYITKYLRHLDTFELGDFIAMSELSHPVTKDISAMITIKPRNYLMEIINKIHD